MVKRKSKYIFAVLIAVAPYASAYAQEKIEEAAPPSGMRGAPANLPDVSVIGEIYGFTGDGEYADMNKVLFNSAELALQGYLYPKMRTDIIFAMHKHDEELEWELEEAKVTGNQILGNLGLVAGKSLVGIGKVNTLHPHHRSYFSQPAVLNNFFGDHGLMAEGLQLNYLMPLPFFAQVSVGAWQGGEHTHSHASEEPETADILDVTGSTVTVALYEEEESEEFSLAGEIYTGRLWTSFPLSSISELEVGLNMAKGNGAHFEHHMDNVKVQGIDLTFKRWPTAHKRFIWQIELYQMKREVPVGELERTGYYTFLGYRLNKYWETGLRYDSSENVLPDLVETESASLILTKKMTETTYLRAEYQNYSKPEKENKVYLQFVWGIGPHSHPLE